MRYRKWILIGCLTLLANPEWVATAYGAEAKEPYVSYTIIEKRETPTDHREIITQIYLDAAANVGYRYNDRVLGSTAPTVKSVQFSNEFERMATSEEKAQFVHELIEAKVFELTSDSRDDRARYKAYLRVRFGETDKVVYFFTPPRANRKIIHDVIMGFASQVGVDKPKDAVQATKIMEGDLVRARPVRLSDLLDNPDEYDGKRVSIVGFFHGEFESHGFYVDESAYRSRDHKRGIWRGEPSSFANKSTLNDKNDSWLLLEGVFINGRSGHMGAWPGNITRLTRIEPILAP